MSRYPEVAAKVDAFFAARRAAPRRGHAVPHRLLGLLSHPPHGHRASRPQAIARRGRARGRPSSARRWRRTSRARPTGARRSMPQRPLPHLRGAADRVPLARRADPPARRLAAGRAARASATSPRGPDTPTPTASSIRQTLSAIVLAVNGGDDEPRSISLPTRVLDSARRCLSRRRPRSPALPRGRGRGVHASASSPTA